MRNELEWSPLKQAQQKLYDYIKATHPEDKEALKFIVDVSYHINHITLTCQRLKNHILAVENITGDLVSKIDDMEKIENAVKNPKAKR